MKSAWDRIKDALILAVSAKVGVTFTVYEADGLLNIMNAYDELEAENDALREQVRWIPVSDKKPPEQDFVLCYAPEYDSVEIRRTDLIGQAITHWRPLPLPPEA